MEHVMFAVNNSPDQDTPDDAELRALDAWLDRAAPVRRFGARLRPPDDAVVVRRRDGELLVTDGPFVEATEWIGGFDVLDVGSIDEAVALASEHPAARDVRVEVRAAWPLSEEDQ